MSDHDWIKAHPAWGGECRIGSTGFADADSSLLAPVDIKVHFYLEGGTSVQVGNDAMLAWNIMIRTSDAHALIATTSGDIG